MAVPLPAGFIAEYSLSHEYVDIGSNNDYRYHNIVCPEKLKKIAVGTYFPVPVQYFFHIKGEKY